MSVRSIFLLIGAISTFSFISLVTANAVFVPVDPNAACQTKICVVVRTFSEYQTLTGAGLAIIAAYVAARPAWLQLRKMRLQQDIAARSAIVKRLKGMERRGQDMKNEIVPLISDIRMRIYDNFEECEYDPKSVNVHWAHDKISQCESIISKLESQQNLLRDTHRIEEARRKVIDAARSLGNCFSNISYLASNSGDPEITPELEEELFYLEEQGREELPDKCDVLDTVHSEAQRVIESEISVIRQRLRQIDDAILAEPE